MGIRDWFRRKPLITEVEYGRLITSFSRAIDRDPMVRGPAEALAERVRGDEPALVVLVDGEQYEGAAAFQLRLLAGAWIMAAEGSVPRETAEVFVEALIWKFPKGAERLPRRVAELAQGEFERDLAVEC